MLNQVSNILVLELCERGELFDLLSRGGPVPPEVCKEYFRQLMDGIKYCHGALAACVCVFVVSFFTAVCCVLCCVCCLLLVLVFA